MDHPEDLYLLDAEQAVRELAVFLDSASDAQPQRVLATIGYLATTLRTIGLVQLGLAGERLAATLAQLDAGQGRRSIRELTELTHSALEAARKGQPSPDGGERVQRLLERLASDPLSDQVRSLGVPGRHADHDLLRHAFTALQAADSFAAILSRETIPFADPALAAEAIRSSDARAGDERADGARAERLPEAATGEGARLQALPLGDDLADVIPAIMATAVTANTIGSSIDLPNDGTLCGGRARENGAREGGAPEDGASALADLGPRRPALTEALRQVPEPKASGPSVAVPLESAPPAPFPERAPLGPANRVEGAAPAPTTKPARRRRQNGSVSHVSGSQETPPSVPVSRTASAEALREGSAGTTPLVAMPRFTQATPPPNRAVDAAFRQALRLADPSSWARGLATLLESIDVLDHQPLGLSFPAHIKLLHGAELVCQSAVVELLGGVFASVACAGIAQASLNAHTLSLVVEFEQATSADPLARALARLGGRIEVAAGERRWSIVTPSSARLLRIMPLKLGEQWIAVSWAQYLGLDPATQGEAQLRIGDEMDRLRIDATGAVVVGVRFDLDGTLRRRERYRGLVLTPQAQWLPTYA